MNNVVANVILSIRPDLDLTGRLDDDLIGVLNSMDIVLIVDELENRLGISIPADQIIPENFQSVNALAAFLQVCMK